jgi:hypothetical protein
LPTWDTGSTEFDAQTDLQRAKRALKTNQAVQMHKPTPQEAPTMNFRATAQLLGDAIAAFALILLPFAMAWARFILTGTL